MGLAETVRAFLAYEAALFRSDRAMSMSELDAMMDGYCAARARLIELTKETDDAMAQAPAGEVVSKQG